MEVYDRKTGANNYVSTEGYQIYLMLQLAKCKGFIDEELGYDEEWGEAIKLYERFHASKYNVDTETEYGCIEDFLNNTPHPDSRVYEIDKVYADTDELINSKEFKDIYAPYCSSVYDRSVRMRSQYPAEIAFRVKTDPDKNYGREYDIYYVVEANDGVRILNKVEAGASLTNQLFRKVRLLDDNKVVEITTQRYMRDNKTRRALANAGIIVTTV